MAKDGHIATFRPKTFVSSGVQHTQQPIHAWSTYKNGDVKEFSAECQGSGTFYYR